MTYLLLTSCMYYVKHGVFFLTIFFPYLSRGSQALSLV